MLLFLFLQAILKLTEAGSDSFLNLEKAIKAIHEVLLYHCQVFFSEWNWTTQWCHCVLLPDSDWVWQGGLENEMYRGVGLTGAANWFWQSQGDNFLVSSLRLSYELFIFCNPWMTAKLTAASSFISVSSSDHQRALPRAQGFCETADCWSHLLCKSVIYQHLHSPLQWPPDHLLQKVWHSHTQQMLFFF